MAKTVREFLDELNEQVERDESLLDRPLLAVHQPGYPIQENVGGIYVPGNEEWRDHYKHQAWECPSCGEEQPPSMSRFVEREDEEPVCIMCFDDIMGDEGDEPVLYIVLAGQPMDRSPYGPRAAWEDGF